MCCDTSSVSNLPLEKLDIDAMLLCGSVTLLSAVLSPMGVALANHAKIPDFARSRGFNDGHLYDWLCLVDGKTRTSNNSATPPPVASSKEQLEVARVSKGRARAGLEGRGKGWARVRGWG